MMRRAILSLALAACFAVESADVRAQEFELTGCTPANLQTGDVALLTLTGKLPSGGLTVEFFPQRIRVLNVTLVDEVTLAVQVSVPFDAPTGAYNIIVFSQDGQEAVGTGLLTLGRQARTPRILSYEPLEAQASLVELDLKLHCESLERDAIDGLTVRWTRGGVEAAQVSSEFKYGGATLLLLHIAGTMLAGDNLGTVSFRGQPIFLVKLRRIDTPWSVFGHRPVQIANDAPGCEILFLGRGLSPIALTDATARISAQDGAEVIAVNLDWRDTSRAAASITPLPPAGEYAVELVQDGVVAYQGPLVVLTPEALAEIRSRPRHAPAVVDPEHAAPRSRPNRPRVPQPRQQLPGWDEAKPAQAQAAASMSTESLPEQSDAGDRARGLLLDQGVVNPGQIDASTPVLRLSISELPISATSDVSLFTASLGRDSSEAELVFLGQDKKGLLLLFKIGEAGWGTGPYRLELRDDQGKLLLSRQLEVSGSEQPQQ